MKVTIIMPTTLLQFVAHVLVGSIIGTTIGLIIFWSIRFWRAYCLPYYRCWDSICVMAGRLTDMVATMTRDEHRTKCIEAMAMALIGGGNAPEWSKSLARHQATIAFDSLYGIARVVPEAGGIWLAAIDLTNPPEENGP